MRRKIASCFASIICGICMLGGAAYAQDMMNCDQETFDKVMMEVDNSSDAAMKEKGMMELDMAKTAMKADKSDECAEHLDMAAKAVMME